MSPLYARSTVFNKHRYINYCLYTDGKKLAKPAFFVTRIT